MRPNGDSYDAPGLEVQVSADLRRAEDSNAFAHRHIFAEPLKLFAVGFTLGRFGAWEYVNSDNCLWQGARLADRLMEGEARHAPDSGAALATPR